MHINVTETMFIEELRKMDRMDNFSYKGLRALFEHFEELEDDTGESIECDVIAICCDFSELSVEDVITEYPDLFDQDIIEKLDDEDRMEIVLEALQEETMVIPVDDERLIIQAF